MSEIDNINPFDPQKKTRKIAPFIIFGVVVIILVSIFSIRALSRRAFKKSFKNITVEVLWEQAIRADPGIQNIGFDQFSKDANRYFREDEKWKKNNERLCLDVCTKAVSDYHITIEQGKASHDEVFFNSDLDSCLTVVSERSSVTDRQSNYFKNTVLLNCTTGKTLQRLNYDSTQGIKKFYDEVDKLKLKEIYEPEWIDRIN